MSSFAVPGQHAASATENLSVTNSALHGDGIVSRCSIPAGMLVFKEKPLCFLQTLSNVQDVIVCGQCQRFLGNMDTQIRVLSKAINRQTLVNSDCPDIPFQCKDKCGEFYCSESCRSQHWNRHRLLCTGALSDEEAESSALFQFKVHACQTNSIFLLVADVFAKICDDVERMRLEGSHDDDAIISRAMEPYGRFVRNLWWDAVSAESDLVTDISIDGSAANKSSKNELSATLKLLVDDSWELLRKALNLDGRGLTEALTKEYFSRTIGMFEQNNIGVRCSHPIAATIASLVPHKDSKLAKAILAGAEKIVEHMDENQMCDEEGAEDGEGDWEDVEDESEEDTAEEADMCTDEAANSPTGDEDLDNLKELLEERGVQSVFPDLDGTALYSVLCKINHSCQPNAIVTYECTDKGLAARLTALRDIKPGEELLHSYIDQSMDYDSRRRALLDYGFQCQCCKCASTS